jgi:hypothetical protein
MTQVNPVKKAGRYVLLGLLCIALLYALGTAPSYAAGHIPVSGVAP